MILLEKNEPPYHSNEFIIKIRMWFTSEHHFLLLSISMRHSVIVFCSVQPSYVSLEHTACIKCVYTWCDAVCSKLGPPWERIRKGGVACDSVAMAFRLSCNWWYTGGRQTENSHPSSQFVCFFICRAAAQEIRWWQKMKFGTIKRGIKCAVAFKMKKNMQASVVN